MRNVPQCFDAERKNFTRARLTFATLVVRFQKLKADIVKIEKERDLKKGSSRKLNESLAKKVETAHMEENLKHYVVNGNQNWTLLQEHVYIIEKYCKEHFGDIFSIAIEGKNTLSGDQPMTRVKANSKIGNPTKSVLEIKP